MKAKQGKKENTIEAALCPIIRELLLENNSILASKIWGIIIGGNRIHGHYDERRPREFQSEDFGTIYQNTITIIICDKFGAVKKHTEKGSLMIFDKEKFLKVSESYELETKIQLTGNYQPSAALTTLGNHLPHLKKILMQKLQGMNRI